MRGHFKKKDPLDRVCAARRLVGERHITRRTKVLSDTKGKTWRNKKRENWKGRKIDLIIIYSILRTNTPSPLAEALHGVDWLPPVSCFARPSTAIRLDIP